MSSFNFIKLIAPLAALALLTACGGGGSGSSATSLPAPAPTSQSADLSQNAGQSVQSALEDATRSMNPTNLSSDARSPQAANPCISASPQPPVINSDGLPANETYTVTNCTQQLAGGRTATLNGQYSIVDNTQQGGNLTWTRSVPNMNVAITSSSFNATDARNGQGVHTLTSPTTETIVRSFTNNWTGVTNPWTAVNTENITFTSSGATIVPLAWPPSGTIQFTGTHAVTQGTNNVTYNMSTPGSGLTYDSTCGFLPRITAGSVVLVPTTTGSTITVTFTGCGNLPTITKS